MIDSNSDDEPEEFAPKIDKLCQLGAAWIDQASPAELWEVLEHGGLDERVGMAGTLSNLGTLPGPAATFLHRQLLKVEVAEVRFALGAIQWMSTEGT